MKPIQSFCILSAVFYFLLLGNVSSQNIVLPSIFSDNMVLQQKTNVTIWGWAFRGEVITVKPQWGIGKTSKADSTGKWTVELETPEAGGGPYSIYIKGAGSELILKNILMGEVWLCSGQSNMEMPLKGWPPKDTVLGSSFEIRTANYPKIRMYTVTRALSVVPTSNCKGSWEEATPEKVKEFSATAYFFGKKLFEELKVPIGLIHTSWGGTPIESWMSMEALSMYPAYKNLKENYRQLAGEQNEKTNWLENHKKIDLSKRVATSLWEGLNFDDSLCSQPDLYDFEWERMKLPMAWEKSPIGDFDGAVWFRKTIDLPGAWSGKDMVICLPGIDDMDQTWINGVKVGATEIPGYWQTARRYEIPNSIVKSGKLVVAIRVIDHQGGGGIWDTHQPMEIRLKGDSTQKISLTGYWRYIPVAEYQNNVFYIFDSKTREYQMRASIKNPGPGLPSVLYNAMIHPLTSYKIKGFIWYQGESNVDQASNYASYMNAMVNAWRKDWGQEIPFYFVQIAPYKYTGAMKMESAELRIAQFKAQNSIKKSGMVVTLDIGDVNNIHPCKKKQVGERLAYWALAKEYNRAILYSGPQYKSKKTEGTNLRLYFDYSENGLALQGDFLSCFEIAGADKKYVKAEQVKIETNSLVVFSSKVSNPMFVRYAGRNGSEATLFNMDSRGQVMLPASSFVAE